MNSTISILSELEIKESRNVHKICKRFGHNIIAILCETRLYMLEQTYSTGSLFSLLIFKLESSSLGQIRDKFDVYIRRC